MRRRAALTPERHRLDELKIDRTGDEPESPSRRHLVAFTMMVVVVVALVAWWLADRSPAEVRLATARELSGGAQGTVLNASGYVTARRRATVSSKVTGKVTEVLIEEGMEVAEGEVLARLDTSNVEASLRLAQAELVSAKSAMRETEVRLKEARLELGRIARLVDRGISSQAELDAARAEVDSLAARLERQRDDVEVARSDVLLWQQEMEDRVIRAPFAGVVVAKNAQPGEMISPISAGGGFTRTGIGTLVDMSSLEIEVDVNEAYINRVLPGQAVAATLDAYPDWQIPGRVIAIIPTADRQKATVQVRVGFDELDPRILPDMGVKVAFQDGSASQDRARGVVVPGAALRSDRGREVVLVVAADRVESRAVRVGESLGDDVLIATGLAAGESVVVEGPEDLRDGDRVRGSTE